MENKETDYYVVDDDESACENCSQIDTLRIPRGMIVSKYKASHTCDFCGCLLDGKEISVKAEKARYDSYEDD